MLHTFGVQVDLRLNRMACFLLSLSLWRAACFAKSSWLWRRSCGQETNLSNKGGQGALCIQILQRLWARSSMPRAAQGFRVKPWYLLPTCGNSSSSDNNPRLTTSPLIKMIDRCLAEECLKHSSQDAPEGAHTVS